VDALIVDALTNGGGLIVTNRRRGFFRIWVVLSALWFIIVAGFSYQKVADPYIAPRVYVLPSQTGEFYQLNNVLDQFDLEFRNAHNEVSFPNSVTLFSTKDIPMAVVEARSPSFYEKYSKPRDAELTKARLTALGLSIAAALVPPAVLLLIGTAISWIASGFKADAPYGGAGFGKPSPD
jgi:hypothetical protein